MDTTTLHDFLETAPDAMLLINAHGNIVHTNIPAPWLHALRKHLVPARRAVLPHNRTARGARRGA